MIIFLTIFTGLGKGSGYAGDKWLKRRIEIFKDYTLKSLLGQTDRNFLHWIAWRPEEKFNLRVMELEKYLKELNYNFIFTYDGVMYYDDKKLERNRTLKERLQKSLDQLDVKENVCLVTMPSDDMYSKELVESIRKQPFKEKTALVHFYGYIYDIRTDQLAEWRPETNPPFFTIMFPNDVFLDAEKHLEYMGDFKSHEDIIKVFNYVRMPDNRYCVLVHGHNISTIWEHQYKGKEFVYEEEKTKILNNFI